MLALLALLSAGSAAAATTQHGIPPVLVGTPAAFTGGTPIWAEDPETGWCQWLGVDCQNVVEIATSPTENSGVNVADQIGVVCRVGSFVKVNYKHEVYGPDITGWAPSGEVRLGPMFHADSDITDDNVDPCGPRDSS